MITKKELRQYARLSFSCELRYSGKSKTFYIHGKHNASCKRALMANYPNVDYNFEAYENCVNKLGNNKVQKQKL